MRRDIVTSVVAMVVLTLLLGIVYPLVIWGISQGVFSGNANGERVYLGSRLVGSKLIGQSFEVPVVGKDGRPQTREGKSVLEPDPLYFQSRPSATEPGPYNAAASAFSNRGPNSTRTAQADAAYIEAYLQLNRPYDPGLTAGGIPVDAVSTSASGLDPQISIANARIQAHRIAYFHETTLADIDKLIAHYTSGRGLGFSGEPGVNVLELNLALSCPCRALPKR